MSMHPSQSSAAINPAGGPALKRAATVNSLSSKSSSSSSLTPASPSSPAALNAHAALHEYFLEILKLIPGPKSLLLDLETTGILSMFSSQSEILRHEVYLSECVDIIAARDDLHEQTFHYLTALVIMQPTKQSLNAMKTLLATRRYSSYYIILTNVTPADYIDALAAADSTQAIKEVHEFYCDYYAVSPTLFHFNNSVRTAGRRSGHTKDLTRAQLDRDTAGLLALSLALKRRPDIRFADSSDLARVLATRVQEEMRINSELFHFHSDPTLLLILDRRDDPVTPLLTQWTYQAMVHELIGINNNRIDMKRFGVANKDLEELILSPQQDAFFRANQFSNFGEMGAKVKALVSEYQQKTRSEIKMETIEDLQRVIENFPEFRAMSGTVAKHVALMSELGKIVSARRLMAVSALEQEIVVCNAVNDHEEITGKLFDMLARSDVDWDDKLRVSLIYALRFEGEEQSGFSGNIKRIHQALLEQAIDGRQLQQLKSIDLLLDYGGINARRSELFKGGLLKHFIRAFKSEIKGVENIYTQHKPLLHEQLTKLLAGDLKAADYPFVDGSLGSAKTKYKSIIVFITGGVTLEEFAAVETALGQTAGPADKNTGQTTGPKVVQAGLGKLGVQAFNRADYKIVLGGSCLHNSQSFLYGLNPIKEDLTEGKMMKISEAEMKKEAEMEKQPLGEEIV